MIRKLRRFLPALLILAVLSACSSGIDYRLPASPLAFVAHDFANPSDPDDTYLSVTYNGRTYIPYGTLQGTLTGRDLGPCLGYLLSENTKDDSDRVFPLADDPDADYLAVITRKGFMDQPMFLRAADTARQDIPTPSFIVPLEYDFWK